MIVKQATGQKQNEKRIVFIINSAEKRDILKGYVVRPWGDKILVDANYYFGELGKGSNLASQDEVKV